jgi:hypothetical protein
MFNEDIKELNVWVLVVPLVVGAFAAEPTERLEQFKVPVPVRVQDTFEFGSLYSVTAEDTVSVTEELTDKVAAAPTPVKVMLAHSALTGTVTVKPFSRKTLSPATGNDAPGAPPEVADHVEFAFQFPVATEYRSAAIRAIAENDKTTARKNFLQEGFSFIITSAVLMQKMHYRSRVHFSCNSASANLAGFTSEGAE